MQKKNNKIEKGCYLFEGRNETIETSIDKTLFTMVIMLFTTISRFLSHIYHFSVEVIDRGFYDKETLLKDKEILN